MDPPAVSIVVGDPRKEKSTGSSKVTSSHYDYKVEVKMNGQVCAVRRRFREFSFLHNLLRSRIPGAILPILPNKGVAAQQGKTEHDFVETRAKVNV